MHSYVSKQKQNQSSAPRAADLTLKAQVAHVQDGSQQLGNLPVLRLSEHEDLHGRQDARVIAEVVTTVARRAISLDGKRHKQF